MTVCAAGTLAAAIFDAVLAPESALSIHLDNLPGDVDQHFDGGLPTGEHFALLSADPVAAQVAAQHQALLTALQNCSPSVLSGRHGGSHGLFRHLVALPGAEQGSLQPHLRAVLAAVESSAAPAVFLTEQLGGSSQTSSAQVETHGDLLFYHKLLHQRICCQELSCICAYDDQRMAL